MSHQNRTPVPLERLETQHHISLSALFQRAENHYFENMKQGVVLPQHEQQHDSFQQQARLPIVTKLNNWYKLPADVGALVERFMQCRPGVGYGIAPEDPRMVEYVGACNAFTEALDDAGIHHLRVI